jgi:hypothetical protein
MTRGIRLCVLALVALLPAAAGAQGKDELWEITTRMDVPGMPPGMGSMTQQMCQHRDPDKRAAPGPDMEKCKITERKDTGQRMTMTVTCPEGRVLIEQTYNAARTEFKGSTRIATKEGEMTMISSGRRIGSCDAESSRR